MKNKGKIFEQDIKDSVKDNENILCIRLNDQPQSFAKNAKFSLKNPCDFMMFDCLNRRFYCLELKSTKYKSMSFDDIFVNEDCQNNHMIHRHQIMGLSKYSKYAYVRSAFLLNFRDEENNEQRTWYVDINDFMDFIANTDKSSINIDDCINIGREVVGNKKRTHYKWDLESIMDDIEKEMREEFGE